MCLMLSAAPDIIRDVQVSSLGYILFLSEPENSNDEECMIQCEDSESFIIQSS